MNGKLMFNVRIDKDPEMYHLLDKQVSLTKEEMQVLVNIHASYQKHKDNPQPYIIHEAGTGMMEPWEPKFDKIKTFDESVEEYKAKNKDLHDAQARSMQANIDIHKSYGVRNDH